MPTLIRENHSRRLVAPPQFLTRSQRKLLFFFLKCAIMVIMMFIFLFFLGFAVVLLLHFLFMSNTFHRRCTRLLQPTAATNEALPDIQALIPEIKYRSADYWGTSDCAICLDSFQEGDNCRNIPICKHLFQSKCVDRWIRKKPTCPVCRTRVDLDPPGLPSSRISGDDQWKRLWSVNFAEDVNTLHIVLSNLESAMISFGLYGFLMILNESIKLVPKKGKLMALIAVFSIFLSLCFFSLFIYSLESVVADVLVTFQKSFMPDPDSFPPKPRFSPDQVIGPLNHLKGDFATLLALEIAFFLAISTIFFISSVSTILVSAHSYSDENLSLRELFSIILKTWIRPLITSFYTSCLSIGYILSVLILASPLLLCPNLATFWVALFVGFPALILYLYLLVPWTLSIVISVVEESCYGMEGLGKAAALVKGKRLHGFLLNVVYALLVLSVFKGYKLSRDKWYVTIAWVLLTIVLSLWKIFEMVAYTVLYCQCKEQNGEEIELYGSVQYSKLPTTSIVLANDTP